MITGFSAHPGKFPYGLDARTRSTLSSHRSPSPPALRFQGEGTALFEPEPPALRGRRGDVGAATGGAVASRASAGGAHELRPPGRLTRVAISARPTSEGVRWCPPSLGCPGAPFEGAGFSTNSVTRTARASSRGSSSLFPDNELAALFRPLETEMAARTTGSSPCHTCASATSTFLEMLSNDLVRICEGLTPAAPPEKRPPPRAAATAAVGDIAAGVIAGDSGGFPFGFSVERPFVWLVRLSASTPSGGAVAVSSSMQSCASDRLLNELPFRVSPRTLSRRDASPPAKAFKPGCSGPLFEENVDDVKLDVLISAASCPPDPIAPARKSCVDHRGVDMSCSGSESLDSREWRGVLPVRRLTGLPSRLHSSPGAAITSRHSRYGAFSRELRSTASLAGMRTTRACVSPMGNITPAPGAWPSMSASETLSMPSFRRAWRPSGGNTLLSFVDSPHRSSASFRVDANVSTRCEDCIFGSASSFRASKVVPSSRPETLARLNPAASARVGDPGSSEKASAASAEAALTRAIPESRADARPATSSIRSGWSSMGDISANGGRHSPASAACLHASRSAMMGPGFLESPAAAASSQQVCVPSRMLRAHARTMARSRLLCGRMICRVMIWFKYRSTRSSESESSRLHR
mmetsp:Transcript_4786/g.19139  ORF Transcript_4786/g.19139 Transcript_4786/m.19139 type:complete len:638 (+) Transcript_4786:883-2796(+)